MNTVFPTKTVGKTVFSYARNYAEKLEICHAVDSLNENDRSNKDDKMKAFV